MIFEPITAMWPESELDQVYSSFSEGKKARVSGLKGSAKAIYLRLLQQRLQMPLVFVTANAPQAEEYYKDLQFLEKTLTPKTNRSESNILYFPDYDTEPYQGTSPHPQIRVWRMQAFWKLLQKTANMIIVPVQALARRLPPPEAFRRGFSSIEWGQVLDPTEIASLLTRYGYQEKDLVTSRGEFSLRGGIVDFFSPSEELPIRLEFFGNKIESMRTFDTDTQRSIQEIEKSTILALREMLLTQPELELWGNASAQRWYGDFYHEELVERTEQLLELGYFEGYEEFIPIFFPSSATLLDYLSEDCCVVLDEPETLSKNYESLLQHYRDRFQHVHEQRKLALESEEIFHEWETIQTQAEKYHELILSDFILEKGENEVVFEYSFQSARQYNGQVQEIVSDTQRLQETGFTSFFIFPTIGKAERLAEILREYETPLIYISDPLNPQEHLTPDSIRGKVIISSGNLTHGWRNPEHQIALFTEDDLFGESRPLTQVRTRKAAGTFLSDLRDLKLHDYVVHVDHGIGQFTGLSTMHIEGQEKEFLLLRFAEDDKLYVPVERMDLIQKYMGASDATPRLDKLGSNVWQKAKSRAKASMKEMAEKLLQLYAYRKTVRGFQFPPDDAFQREFEDAFEFQETPHQLAAIEEVKADMEAERPMDRLICGDVGYGKTEVAMRAAFKAVNSGKQVAVLAPTTILAFQHFHTFQKRFEMFPVTIAMVSRFKSRAEIKKTLEEVREGKVDILIGTHRLLSGDVQFQDLGVMIVDEEQRFGVAHKEKLKEIKKNVDALALTATPIPRTLQMALMGFRPMSVIETPPKDRLAIQTNIVKSSEDIVEAAIRAELKRSGQVYFVHNRVETIDSIAAMVRRLIPEARVAIVHGQMVESEIEKIMMQFINHEYDVLVSTTIIENGIDIPLVNTLIVNRADRYGLSQLYQLRGRVGRSHRRAYAYFLIPSEKDLTPIARRRLAALREFTELGSGFRLAALDLEIRGAGNLLGSEQHGHIAALGFELYCRMLEQTVKELQGEEAPAEFATAVNLNIDIKIPEEYIPNMNQRLNLYKRIASVQSEESLQRLREEMTDRFGTIPEQVENLLEYGRVKLKAEKLKIRSIDRSDGSLFFQLTQNGNIPPENIFKMIHRYKGAAISPAGVLSFSGQQLDIPRNLFLTVGNLLEELEKGNVH
jgi:transcription-repair coupling factor (superfamily II helicase)